MCLEMLDGVEATMKWMLGDLDFFSEWVGLLQEIR
jgi:hypothetical protein